jgi:hypothetical protein
MQSRVGDLVRNADFPNGIQTPADVQRLGALLNPRLKDAAKLSANGVNASTNLDAQAVSFQVTTPASDWTDLTLAAGANLGGAYPNLGWRRDALGTVSVRGALKTLPALTTVLATLPAAAAPVSTYRVTADAAGAYGAVEIAANGQITQVVGSTAGNLYIAASFPSTNESAGVLSIFPQHIRIRDGRKPLAVLLLSCADHAQSGASTPSILVPGLQWSYQAANAGGPNLLSIDGMPGLALGRSYDVSILVLFS